MIELAEQTQELIRERARLAGTSPDALVRAAIAALPSISQARADQHADLAAVLARFDTLARSSDQRSAKAILDEAWSS